MAAFFIFIVVAFFFIITLSTVGMWQSYKEEGMLGSLVVMWAIITLFVLAVYVGGKNRQTQKGQEAVSEKEISVTAPSFF